VGTWFGISAGGHPPGAVIQDSTLGTAFWEVGGNEPGIDLEAVGSAPRSWARVTDAAPVSVPVDRPGGPFRFRAPAGSGLAPTADVNATLERLATETRLVVSVRPRVSGAAVALYLPPGVKPCDASIPGVFRGPRWRAIYVAPPPEGVTFRVTLRIEDEATVSESRVAVVTPGLPGGSGPQGLPPWLPQEWVAWRARTCAVQGFTAVRLGPAKPEDGNGP
jgi:hypothetical protein